jgi:8-amino-7-oxononanoate synthase
MMMQRVSSEMGRSAEPGRAGGSILAPLRRTVDTRPEAVALRFLTEGDASGPVEVMTFGRLDVRARAIAATLQGRGLAGAPVLLIYPPGTDFITAFLACLYAGVIAVPAYPPEVAHLERSLPRLRAIVNDSGARTVLTTAAIEGFAEAVFPGAPELRACQWLATDTIDASAASGFADRDVSPGEAAFLQYTSGSTAAPRGVRVTHGNLLHNIEQLARLGSLTPESVMVGWLPSYHDMGLIGSILMPVAVGITSVLMSPLAFLKNPARWLQAISRFRGTSSAFPNFALDLCVRRVTEDERAGLDLRSWRTAVNGAEPVRRASLDAFAQRFAGVGFDHRAFLPMYGLAESTLMVSGGPAAHAARVRPVSRRELSHGRVRKPGDAPDTVDLVACGEAMEDTQIEIVDPDRRVRASAHEVGEIWLRGRSVAAGYWNRAEESEAVFGAHLEDTGEGPFLRTGDLGFVEEGQLFVTGRRKDVIILSGANHYPQDLEGATERAHPAVRPGAVAAVGVERDGREHLAVVAEVRDGVARGELDAVALAIRGALLDTLGVSPDVLALIPAGAIHKTSSGKVQRHACRRALEERSLTALLLEDRTESSPASPPPAREDAPRAARAPAAADPAVATLAVTHAVVATLARVTGNAASALTPGTRLVAYLGLDSLALNETIAALEETFGPLGDDVFGDTDTTLESLVRTVEGRAAPSAIAALLGSVAPRPPPPSLPAPAPAAPEPPPSGKADVARPRETRIEEFAESKEIAPLLMLFDALGVGNPYFSSLEGPAADTATVDGASLLNFATYNYLGLVGDPRVDAAAGEAIRRYGTSASASRVASGDRPIHRELEAEIASFLGCEEALVFASGHATNVASISTLVGREDLIVHDALAHDSILAGARLSGARRVSFAHNDVADLDRVLQGRRDTARRALIVVEGVYSMDGDLAPLAAIVEIKKRHGALLFVDEAHSLGCVGPTGRGIGEHAAVARGDVDVWMGTLSKSLASCGGYVAGSRALVELMKYKAGGFVFSAAISPANAAAALAALRVLEREPARVAALQERAALFGRLCRERGVDTGTSGGAAIVPAILGTSVRCLQIAHALRQEGINVPPIFHPAVEEGKARLRFFISSLHSEVQLTRAADALGRALQRYPAPARARPATLASAPSPIGPAPGNPRRSVRKVFVTGASGFIGARVVRALVERGVEVRCLLRPTSRTTRLDGLRYERQRGDLHDVRALEQGAAGCDAVIHLACASSWTDIRRAGPRLRDIAVDGTRNVLEAARRSGVRSFVHVSSVAAVNGSEAPVVHDETSPYELGSRGLAYSLAKREAEELVLRAAGPSLDVVVVSPAEVYGPDDVDLVTAGNLIEILDAAPAVACDGGVSVVHVDDVASGIVAALVHGRPGERYILGGENLSIHELSRLVLRLAGRRESVVDVPNDVAVRLCHRMSLAGLPPPISLDVLDYATLFWFVDSSKAARELGYAPRGASDTLGPVVRWLKASGRSLAAHRESEAQR